MVKIFLFIVAAFFSSFALASKCDHSSLVIHNESKKNLTILETVHDGASIITGDDIGREIASYDIIEIEASSGKGTFGNTGGQIILGVDTYKLVDLTYHFDRNLLNCDPGHDLPILILNDIKLSANYTAQKGTPGRIYLYIKDK